MTTDFNLFDIIRIRLVNPDQKHIDFITNLTGVQTSKCEEIPDIKITYRDKISANNITLIGLDAGFDETNFYVLVKNVDTSKAIIPFDKIGEKCEIICEADLVNIPLLHEIILFSFLKKNWVAIHSSSFVFNGKGALILSWSNGGKTSTLLSFLKNGAEFVSDEWTIISEKGESLHRLPSELSIWEWYFKDIKNILPKINIQQKINFSLIHAILKINDLSKKFGFQDLEFFKIINRLGVRLKNNLRIHVRPKNLKNIKIASGKTKLDLVLFTVSSLDEDIKIQKILENDVIERMVQSNKQEYEDLFSHYAKFRFAFPDKRNVLIDNFEETHKKILASCFLGKDIYKVIHPYPVPIDKLYNILEKKLFTNNSSIGEL
jgi:hypothetical protein